MEDTNKKIQDLQDTLFKNASISQKILAVESLSHAVRQMSLRGIRNAFPTLDEDEVRLKFIEINFGARVASLVPRKS